MQMHIYIYIYIMPDCLLIETICSYLIYCKLSVINSNSQVKDRLNVDKSIHVT